MYEPLPDSIPSRFAYHTLDSEQTRLAVAQVRSTLAATAETLTNLMPATAKREKALVLTKLEEAMFHANAGIARHQLEVEPTP